jgi:hypothetical protein
MCNINCLTAGVAVFGANAAEEEHQTCQTTMLLDNLANVSIQKNVTINNLVASNAQLAQALQEMQAAMVRMFSTGQMHAPLPYQPLLWMPIPPEAAAPPTSSPAPPPATMGPCLSHWGSVKPAWDKQGYCWSHVHKIKVGHTSMTCSSRHVGHQPSTTQANTMGGSIYNTGYPFRNRALPPAPTLRHKPVDHR